MATSRDMLLSILAMDSYNRGYSPGIEGLGGPGSMIGGARMLDISIPSGSEAVGFYAAAYRLADGSTVISYRGTDAAPDYFRGWSIALEFVNDGTQAPYALDFYNAVTGTKGLQGPAANVVLTGHSLGGLLAGYVAALTGTKAHIFDHAPFAMGAVAKSLIERGVPPPATELDQFLKLSQITAESVDNEILESARNGNIQLAVGGLGSLTPLLGSFLAGYGLTNAGVTLLVESLIKTLPAFDSHSGVSELTPNPFDQYTERSLKLHMMEYLVVLKFAEMNGHADWHSIGQEFYKAFFDDEVGQAAGFQKANSGGTASYAGKMGRAIAYSALEEEEGTVFGNTAIKAMFNDGDELGKLVSGTGSPRKFEAVKEQLTKLIVQFAGGLAIGKVKESEQKKALDGVLKLDDKTLTVDFSQDVWFKKEIWDEAKGTGATSLVKPQDVLDKYNSSSGQLSTDGAELTRLYEASSGRVEIDRIVLATSDGSATVTAPDRTTSSTKFTAFAAGDRDDDIAGSKDNDLILGNEGDDTIAGGEGDNLIAGGRGNDDLTGGSKLDIIFGGAGNDTIDGGGGDDQLYGASSDFGADSYFTNTLHGGAGNDKLFGAAGSDKLY